MATAQRSHRHTALQPVPQPGKGNRFRRFYCNVAALIAGAGLILLLQWMTTLPTTLEQSPAHFTNHAEQTIASLPHSPQPSALEKAAYAEVPTIGAESLFPKDLHTDLLEENFDVLRQKLLKLAMQAVREYDNTKLADTLMLLGVAALAENNTDSAGVFLQEALAVFEEIGDELGSAKVHLHIGRMHLKDRRIARRAALAYDAGLLARLEISNGFFHDAVPTLQRAIDENIELSRYGAAARDYEALSAGYLEYGQWDEAASTAIEAAKLHAASGRLENAQKLLKNLTDASVVNVDLESLNSTLASLHEDYENSVEQIGRARDYQQLYHHFIAEGDPVRAWQFRLQADASLKKASKRARYRRQAGVLVLLYNSNDSMRKARSSLSTAHAVFSTRSIDSMAEQSEQLLKEVY